MCHGNPDEILAEILKARPLARDARGYTAMDDFDHFCAYSGCNESAVGKETFAWARLAYISAKLPPT